MQCVPAFLINNTHLLLWILASYLCRSLPLVVSYLQFSSVTLTLNSSKTCLHLVFNFQRSHFEEHHLVASKKIFQLVKQKAISPIWRWLPHKPHTLAASHRSKVSATYYLKSCFPNLMQISPDMQTSSSASIMELIIYHVSDFQFPLPTIAVDGCSILQID